MEGIHHHFVDDAHDCGVHGAVLALRGIARGAAGYHQDGFAKAGIDRVYGDEVARFICALRRDWFHYKKLLAFQARVFARRDHSADNAGENHFLSNALKFIDLPMKRLDPAQLQRLKPHLSRSHTAGLKPGPPSNVALSQLTLQRDDSVPKSRRATSSRPCRYLGAAAPRAIGSLPRQTL